MFQIFFEELHSFYLHVELQLQKGHFKMYVLCCLVQSFTKQEWLFILDYLNQPSKYGHFCDGNK